MGTFACRISKAFHAHFTCRLKGWKLDINKIKPKQFLRWGFLSSRSALAWGFFWVCCSRACFDRCCWALLLHPSTGQASQKAAALCVKLPSAQPSRPPQKLIPSTPSYACQLKHSLVPLKHCAGMMHQLSCFPQKYDPHLHCLEEPKCLQTFLPTWSPFSEGIEIM